MERPNPAPWLDHGVWSSYLELYGGGISSELPLPAAYLVLSFHVLPAESILFRSLPTACL